MLKTCLRHPPLLMHFFTRIAWHESLHDDINIHYSDVIRAAAYSK